MPGEVVRVVPDQKAGKGVFSGGGLGARVTALESRMSVVETTSTQAAKDAAIAAANTSELLAIANAAKGAAGFIRKHGPKAISFGAGIMTILGIGNPELWKYVSHFFGG